jgi:hypothetical protein
LTRFERRCPPACLRSSWWPNAGYSIDMAFRSGLTQMGLTLRRRHTVVDEPMVAGNTTCAAQRVERPRSSTLARAPLGAQPTSAKEQAQALQVEAWRHLARGLLTSGFAAVRVSPWPEEWCHQMTRGERASRTVIGSRPVSRPCAGQMSCTKETLMPNYLAMGETPSAWIHRPFPGRSAPAQDVGLRLRRPAYDLERA